MSLKARILMKNREAIVKKINAKKAYFKFQSGLYVISEKNINNVEVNGKIKGAEIIFFKGNPSAIGPDENGDKSSAYLDELVIANALEQTSEGPRIQMEGILDALSWFTNPKNLMGLVLILVVIYGVVVGGLF